MKTYYLITSFLAVLFCISGHFAMAAYTNYSINKSRLSLLRGQERSVKHQVKEIEKKIEQLNQVKSFISKADKLGIKEEKWDRFFVNLDKQAISFEKLSLILSQTQNSSHYYFRPKSITVQAGTSSEATQDTAPTDKASQLADEIKSATNPNPAIVKQETDLTISLKGYFLARRGHE